MKETKYTIIKYAICYEGTTDEKLSIEINMNEKPQWACKINDLWISIDELIWLREAITKALGELDREKKGIK